MSRVGIGVGRPVGLAGQATDGFPVSKHVSATEVSCYRLYGARSW